MELSRSGLLAAFACQLILVVVSHPPIPTQSPSTPRPYNTPPPQTYSSSFTTPPPPSGPYSSPSGAYSQPSGPYSSPSGPNSQPSGPYSSPSGPNSQPSGPYSSPSGSNSQPSGPYSSPSGPYSQPSGPYSTPPGPNSQPPPQFSPQSPPFRPPPPPPPPPQFYPIPPPPLPPFQQGNDIWQVPNLYEILAALVPSAVFGPTPWRNPVSNQQIPQPTPPQPPSTTTVTQPAASPTPGAQNNQPAASPTPGAQNNQPAASPTPGAQNNPSPSTPAAQTNPSASPTPATPGALDRTKLVYGFLSQIGGKALLSGAFGGFTNAAGDDSFSLLHGNAIQFATTKFPAAYEMDCARGWEPTAPTRESDVIDCMHPDAGDFGIRGGIFVVSHTLPNPVFAGNDAAGDGKIGAATTTITNEQYSQILQEGSPARKRWLSSLDKVAQGLEVFRNRGITVLYRPLHSMNSNAYWWGASGVNKDPVRVELYKKLWVDLFNYMINVKKLNTLLWVYSADDSSDSRTAYYPGDQYVDIVGLNMYADDPESLVGYNEMTQLNKPFALTEVGPLTSNRQYDYGKLIQAIQTRYPKTFYFIAWNGGQSPLRNKGAWEAYNAPPRVLSLSDLRPQDLFAKLNNKS